MPIAQHLLHRSKWKSTGEWEVWFVCCVTGPICVYHSMANPLTDCFNFRESVFKCVRQRADIYRSVKQISLNCGQVHLHTFLISLDWYQPLSLCKASTDMSSYLCVCVYTNKHIHTSPMMPLANTNANVSQQPRSAGYSSALVTCTSTQMSQQHITPSPWVLHDPGLIKVSSYHL